MAVTVGGSLKRGKKLSVFDVFVVDVVLSGNYSAGGEPLDFAAQLGLESQPVFVHVVGKAGYTFEYDFQNKKLIIRDFPKVTVTGGQAAGAAVQILPDSDAGVFGKTAATTRNIPGRTFGFGVDELAAGAYPGAVAADSIKALVFFSVYIV